jgi:hypothetical protein
MSIADAALFPDDAGQFISLSAFTEWAHRQGDGVKIPDWRMIRRDLPHLIRPKPDQLRNRLFVTHRWDSQEHPDPSGWQLRTLQELGGHYNYRDPNLCFWFDYMSLPQKPRAAIEKQIFRRGVDNIRRTVAECENVTLVSRCGSDQADDLRAMMTRGWIVFELLIARNNIRLPLPLYERTVGHRVQHGRDQQTSWDAVVADVATLVPFDDVGLIRAWFESRRINCTDGSDIKKLAKFLHQELTQKLAADPTFKVRFDVEMRLTQGQLNTLQILEASGLSGCHRNLYLKDRRPAEGRFRAGSPIWIVTFTHRPPMPQLDEWIKCRPNELALRLISPETMRSPMYPGIEWQIDDQRRRIRATLPP